MRGQRGPIPPDTGTVTGDYGENLLRLFPVPRFL
jgi:hypothetical protein